MANRADPFQIRARELCAEAGIDPDSRVTVIGSARGIPAWVNFRGKAQQEHAARVAEEKAKNRLEGVVVGQPDEYKDAPLKIFGDHDEKTIAQMRACGGTGRVVKMGLMADGHVGFSQSVGGVVAYDNQISISGVGTDIACGNYAVKLDVKYEDIVANSQVILEDIKKHISFGIGRMNDEKVEHELFDDADAWRESGMEFAKDKAMAALGSCGTSNHYLDVCYDEDMHVWVGVHFGSRSLGALASKKYLKLAGGVDGMDAPPCVIEADSEIGRGYLAAMHLCGRFAYAGREWVVERVRQMIGGNAIDAVHNHHNFAWPETVDGRDCWVVRKGATPCFPGQRGFIGGSMGDDAVIIEGVESDIAREAMYSTVHGAGRLYGRRQAKNTFTREQMDEWVNSRGVLLSGGDIDESPMAYRRLPDVLANHAGSLKILHTLRPFIVMMAPAGTDDPWKD